MMDEPINQDWQSDWLYSLLFSRAEDAWSACRKSADSKYWQYVLITEWSDAGDSMCGGRPVRSWIRDNDGLNEISVDEIDDHMKKIRGRIYPFILIRFHVFADRKHVVCEEASASTAGSGFRYIVEGEGEFAKLVPDPSGGFWIS